MNLEKKIVEYKREIKDLNQKKDFLVKVCGALIRRSGGSIILTEEEFDQEFKSISQEMLENGVRLSLVEMTLQ